MKRTESLFLALNFSEGNVPDKIQLLPAPDASGRITGNDGRSWTIENPANVALLSNRYLEPQPIDENHSTDLAASHGKSARAFGWYKNIRAEADGSIWADVEWNNEGAWHLREKFYRYLSPAFKVDAAGSIVCIMRAALTNNPNLQLTQLNSADTSPAQEENMDKEICAALGLPETATVNDALAAIGKLKTQVNSGTVDLAAYAPRSELAAMEERATAAEKQVAELNAAQAKAVAESEVEAAIRARKIAPAARDAYVELCSTQDGLERFRKIVASSPEIISSASQMPDTEPPATGSVALNAEEKNVAKVMGYSEEEFVKMKKEAE